MPFERKPHDSGKGERISFIAFANSCYNIMQPEDVDFLKSLGFTAARSDGDDDNFFVRNRIEKSYLSEEHNVKFRKCLAKRADPTKLLAAKPGAVSLECYGRQAERGGGWVAFNAGRDSGVERLVLTPNSVGIWVSELRWTTKRQLALARHERLNFYANVVKAMRQLQKMIGEMPEGTPVLMSIADTAFAASRPLPKEFYKTMEILGASESMPKLEYRVAWGFIGFKGCVPGKAVTAMGQRSTLLRLEGRFKLTKEGKTALIAEAEPDLTSIIDVVTGGGQDCAVVDDETSAPKRIKKSVASRSK